MIIVQFKVLFISSKISFSKEVSRPEVASSKIRIFGFFNNALANTILCFWPLLSLDAFSPISNSKPFSIFKANSFTPEISQIVLKKASSQSLD